jgi:hypothetical protein
VTRKVRADGEDWEIKAKSLGDTGKWAVMKTLAVECLWLTPVILATREAEIWRIVVRGQPQKIILETPPLQLLEQNELEVWDKW